MPTDIDKLEKGLGEGKYPEVIEAVVKEIKSIGDNHKQNYEELRISHEALKKMVDEGKTSGLDETRLEKLSEDVSSRQVAHEQLLADKEVKLNERIDELEVALQRVPQGSEEAKTKLLDEAGNFFTSVKAVRSNDDTGAKVNRQWTDEDADVDVKLYQQYRRAFKHYLRFDEKMLPPDGMKALLVASDPDGGYTVTPAMANKIITRVYEMDPIRQLAAKESITTGAIEWMVDIDEADDAWESETVATPETGTPQFARKRIPVFIQSARPRATQTLIEDSGINIESWLSGKISEKFARTEAAAFVNGSGINKPRGFLTYADGTAWGTIEQVNMGAAAALTGDGFIDVKYSLKEDWLERGTWLMARSTVAAALKLKDGLGGYIWKPGLIASDPSSAILNLPVRMSTTMPTIAVNSLSVVLAEWSEAYMIVDRLGISVQRDPYTIKPFVEFYTRRRVGGDVINYEAIKIGKIAA